MNEQNDMSIEKNITSVDKIQCQWRKTLHFWTKRHVNLEKLYNSGQNANSVEYIFTSMGKTRC